MKKLSLLLFTGIYLFGSLFFVREDAKAATKVVLTLKGKKASINEKTVAIHVGGKDAVLSYLVNGKRKKIKGSWSSTNKKVVKIDKSGRCKALNNGVSTIKFSYIDGKKKKKLTCKVRVYTKPEEINIVDELAVSGESIIKPRETRRIKVELVPSDKALEVNADIKSDYKVFYELFSDEECKKSTDLGIVDSNGNVLAKDFGGEMYLRVGARMNSSSKKVLYSEPYKILIDGLTAEEKRLEDERLKKEAEEARERERLKPSRIEIKENAPMQSGVSNQPNFLTAKIYFKIYDGNGKEVTNDASLNNGSVSVFWNNTQLQVQQPGVALVTLVTNIPGQPQSIGTLGKVTVTYREPAGKDITSTKDVRIAPMSIITKAEVKGIYRYYYDEMSKDFKYEKVLDTENVRMKKGDKIGNSGNIIALNAMPGAYYLLIDATDSYNEFVNDIGLRETALNIQINGKTGIQIDESLDYYGKKVKQSIKPIVIDGRPYLTFPLKEATVEAGEIQIILQGGYVRNVFSKMISDGTTMRFFYLTGQLSGSSEPIQVGKENSLDYILSNSKGEYIKDYDQVLYHLKLTDTFKSGMIYLPDNSNILSSGKKSLFRIRKNPVNNQAEIIYTPQMNILLSGNPLIPISDFGTDEITVLRGYGENLERKLTIYVVKPK